MGFEVVRQFYDSSPRGLSDDKIATDYSQLAGREGVFKRERESDPDLPL
jgi:hypothetical protein